MSIFLNIVSAALIFPVVLLASFFMFIGVLAGQTLGAMLGAIIAVLQLLPDPDNPKSVVLGVLLATVTFFGMIYLMVRFVFLFPLVIFSFGLASLSCVLWEAGTRDAADNLLVWAAAIGVILSAVQLKRTLVPENRSV